MFQIKSLAVPCMAAMVSLAAVSGAVQAQDFPSGPIEVINNSRPGGGSDIFLRFATERAAEILDTDFVHQSMTGGVSTNTLNYVADRPRDGHTLFIVNAGTLLTIMRGTVDLTLDDIVPLVRGTNDPAFLVVRAGAYEDAAAFVEAAQNGTILQGGTNVGGNPHVAALLLRNEIGMQNQVYVPFERSGEIVLNIASGRIDVALLNYDEFEAQAAAGEVEALAIMAPERSSASPDIPTGHEVGIELNLGSVRGIGVLSGTPEPVIEQLEAALLESMHTDEYLQYLAGSGQTEASIGGREEWTQQIMEMNDGYQAVAEEMQLISN